MSNEERRARVFALMTAVLDITDFYEQRVAKLNEEIKVTSQERFMIWEDVRKELTERKESRGNKLGLKEQK